MSPQNSPSDVAAFMLSELRRQGVLYQDQIVDEIAARFGERFVYDNAAGNRAITKEVLKEFANLTPDAIWSVGERYWRPREPHDLPGRRQP